MTPAAVLSIMVKTQGAQTASSQLTTLDKTAKRTSGSLDKSTRAARTHSSALSKLGGAAQLAGIGLGAAGLAKGLSTAVTEYREAQKVGAQTNAVLKSTGEAANVSQKHIENLAGAISKKTGIDDEQIQSSENMLLTFTKLRNETGKGNKIFDQATQVVTDMSVALGQSGKSSAIQLGKALNDPIKGITALRRVGVAFTADQQKQIETLVKSGDTLGAQKLILKELKTEFGGSAAAQATAGDKLKVSFNNLAEAAGGVLVPQLDKAAAVLTKMIDAAAKGEGIARFIVPAFNETKKSVADLTAVLGPLLAYIGPRLVSAFNALPAPIRAVTIALGAMGTVLLVSNPLMAGLAALAAAAILIHRNWSKISPVINNVRDAITAWVTKNKADIDVVVKAFQDVWDIAKAVFQVAFPVILGTAKRQMEGFKTAISGALQVVQGVINVFLGVLHGDWSRVWGGLKTIAKGALTDAFGVLKVMTAPFREIGVRIVHAVADGLGALGHWILQRFKDAANFVIQNVSNLFKGVGSAITKSIGKINPFGDGLGKLPAGGRGSAALKGANASMGPFAAIGSRFGLSVSSGRRPGAITSSGNVSYHSTGEAIDEAGSPAGMMAFFKYMKGHFGSRLAELIYGPGRVGVKDGRPFNFGAALNAQHMDHVHVALDLGKPGVGDGIGKARRMRRPAMLAGDGLGKFTATSYGPPWGGIQGTGVTATGVNLKDAPKRYGIAVDPSVLKLGAKYKVQPNPFGYGGTFKAFDTGGAIKGNRIDFYDWRGRQAQMAWGARSVTVSAAGKNAAKAAPAAGKGAAAGKTAAAAVSPFEQAMASADVAIAGQKTTGTSKTVGNMFGGKVSNAVLAAGNIRAKQKLVGGRIRKIRAALKGKLTPATRLRLTQELAQRLGEHTDLGKQVSDLMHPAAAGDVGGVADIGGDTTAADAAQAQRDADQQAAMDALTQQLEIMNQKLELQTTLAQDALQKYNVSQTDYGTLAKAIASVASGEIGGRVGLGFMSPSFAGGGSRY